MLIYELLAQKRLTDLKSVRPNSTLLEVARDLEQFNIGILLVLNADGLIVGVVSERDLARAFSKHPDDMAMRSVNEIMTTDVVTCGMNDSVVDTLQSMNEQNIRHIPVVENGRPTAIISTREFEFAYHKLQTQARTDHLTGLGNRRHFMEELEKELSRRSRTQTPLSIAIIDIDNFKRINDTYGHDTGDLVICDIAQVLKCETRNYDEIARIGGEEFVIFFPNTDLESARIPCNRIINAVRSQKVTTDAGVIEYTVSLGLYETCLPGENATAILKKADQLLYRAKADGRDRIVDSLQCHEEESDETTTAPMSLDDEYDGRPDLLRAHG